MYLLFYASLSTRTVTVLIHTHSPPTHTRLPSPSLFSSLLPSSSPKKLATRLVPLWFAASRALEIVEALAVAHATKKRKLCALAKSKMPTHQDPALEGDTRSVLERARSKESHARAVSIVSSAIDRERVTRSGRSKVSVPVWLGAPYVFLTLFFCVFAWVRFATLAAPCAAVGTPWATNCKTPAHPLFDFALPGPAADLCACNTFAAAPARAIANTSTSYTCASPTFMEDVYSGMVAGAALTTTAPYVQIMILRGECAVNNTHVSEMLLRLSNLRVLDVNGAYSAIVPPLELPCAAMTEKSHLLILRLESMGIEVIPPEIGRLGKTLSILTLKRNRKLRELPRELGDCKKLGILTVGSNALTAVPSELGLLTGLAQLNLYDNQLTSLPEELGRLTTMERLR